MEIANTIANIVIALCSLISLILSSITLKKVSDINNSNSKTKNKLKDVKITGNYVGRDKNG